LDFKIITTKNEINILDQAQTYDLYTDLIFIDKNNFKKIEFWFEKELFKNNEGLFCYNIII
jgi:hypothetical protein